MNARRKAVASPSRTRRARPAADAARAGADDANRRSADPYLDWARATDFRYVGGPPDRIPLLVELAEGVSYADFVSLRWARRAGVRRNVRFAPLWKSPPLGLADTRFCTVMIGSHRLEAFDRVTSDPGWARVVARFGFGFPPRNLHGPSDAKAPVRRARASPSRASDASPVPVVIGVIDDSIAFAHARFRSKAGGSRVLHVWNQERELRPLAGATSTGLIYGGELGRTQIDEWLHACTHASLVDEDELYRRCGHETYDNDSHKAIGRRLGHGTHVMDLAAGEEPERAPDDRPLVAVQLPSDVTGDTSGAHLVTHVLDGVWYILKRADEYAASIGRSAVPVVINLSYGFAAGPHDGSHALEVALDQIIELRERQGAPLSVVLPAGNSRLTRCHARVSLAARGRFVLDWRVLPDDRTPSSMEIWLPLDASGGPGLEVVVRDPAGGTTPAVRRGGLFPPPAQQPAPCTIDYRPAPPGQRERIVLLLLPTATTAASDVLAASGTWQVVVRNLAPEALDVHAWIQRDDSPYGYPIVGRQSRFDDPNYVRFDRQGRPLKYDPPRASADGGPGSYVERSATLNALATGRRTVVVAGVRRSDLASPAYSSAGALVAGPQPQRLGALPDVAAVCEDSVALAGVLAAGTRTGSVVPMIGTSTSAPSVARYVADRLARGATDGRTEAQAEATRQEQLRPPLAGPSTSPPFADEYGAGRIEQAALRRVR